MHGSLHQQVLLNAQLLVADIWERRKGSVWDLKLVKMYVYKWSIFHVYHVKKLQMRVFASIKKIIAHMIELHKNVHLTVAKHIIKVIAQQQDVILIQLIR